MPHISSGMRDVYQRVASMSKRSVPLVLIAFLVADKTYPLICNIAEHDFILKNSQFFSRNTESIGRSSANDAVCAIIVLYGNFIPKVKFFVLDAVVARCKD